MIYSPFFFVFISSYNEYTFYSLYPFITNDYLGETNEKKLYFYLLLCSFFGIGKIIGFMIWKYFDLRIKNKNLISICFLLSSIVYILWSFSVNIYMLAVTRFVMGMICSNFEIMKKFIKETCGNINSNKYEIIMAIVSKMGGICGLFLGSYLYFYRIPGMRDYPLFTNGIISSIIMILLFINNYIFVNRKIVLNCNCLCKCIDNNDLIVSNRIDDSDESSDDSDIEIENNNSVIIGSNINDEIFNKRANMFISSIVIFSGIYNSYKYLIVLYLYYYKYDVINISNIWTSIEGFSFVCQMLCSYLVSLGENIEYIIYMIMIFVMAIIGTSITLIIKFTDYFSVEQIGLIVGICCINEFAYNIIFIINNKNLKNYPSNKLKWKIFSFATVITQIFSIVLISCMTVLMDYVGNFDKINNNTNSSIIISAEYVFDEYTPFYLVTLLYLFFLVYFKCNRDIILHSL